MTRPAVGASHRATALVLLGWVGLVVGTGRWGRAIADSGTVIRLGAAPLGGWYDWRLNPRVGLPLAVGAVLVAGLPLVVQRWPWRRALVLAMVASALWAVALAATDGWFGLTNPTVLRGDEYLLDVPLVQDPGGFLRGFTDDIDQYATHVRSHPPGLLLGLWGLDRLGLGGPGWAAALFIAGGSAAVPAVLVAVRRVAGEATARSALPFLVLAPAALWVATTADALFAGVGAWAVTGVVLALHRRDRRGDGLALAGGLGFGVLAHLAYGAVLVAAIPAVVAVARQRVRPLLVAALGALPVFVAFSAAGFWWIDGLLTTGREYRESVASTRPYGYFVVANLGALAIVLGPAVLVALGRLRDRSLWMLVGGAVLAVAFADLTGLSKGEVERIWLPFAVWILAAGASLGTRLPAARWWLGVQAAVAVAVQVAVRSRW